MASIGDGIAVGEDVAEVAGTALRSAVLPLGAAVPDLVCVFVSGTGPGGLDVVARAAADTGARVVLGCTADGVIGAGQGHERVKAVSAWAARLPGVRLRPFHLVPARAGALARSGARLEAPAAVHGFPAVAADDRVGLVLADPATFPVEAFVGGSNRAARPLPLVGGLAGAPYTSGPTRLVLDGRVLDHGAVGVVLGGAVRPRVFVSQGCRPIGPAVTVTRADGDAVLELAGRPALRVLGSVLDSLPSEDRVLAATGLQLGVVMDEYADEHERGDFLIRAVVGSVPDSGGLVTAEPVEVGRTVRFHVRDARTAEADLAAALGESRERDGDAAAVDGALLFSGAGRGTSLFPTANHDVLAVRRGLRTRPVAGFFTSGEIAPVGGRNYLHGSTAAVVAFERVPRG